MNYTNTQIAETAPSNDKDLVVSAVMSALRDLEFDTETRNLYMNQRDSYIYGNGLWSTVELPDGANKTMYNFLERVVDIHTAQLMGRLFTVYSTYNKEDLSIHDDENDPDGAKRKVGKLINKSRQTDADARKRMVDAILRDNGGSRLFKHGARIGSAYGTTIFKQWWDTDAKQVKISVIESPQNYRAGWTDSDFRERDFDAYVYQISTSQANRQWKSKADKEFQYTQEGSPFSSSDGGNTSDPISQNAMNPDVPTQTQRNMVTVIDFTGYLDGFKMSGKEVVACQPGEETKLSLLIVGGCLVQAISDEMKMPRYYVINNREVPRRSWGLSDIPDSAMEINADFIERMSDYITLTNKTVFPFYMMKGFDPASLPKKRQREIAAVSMTPDQSIEIVGQAGNLAQEYAAIFQQQMDAFVKVTGIGRVLFDDPTVSADSNQALMTTMKGVIDIVEDKQARWTPVLQQMFTDALEITAAHVPEAKDLIQTDDDWHFRIEWPSVLRREDQSFQTIWLNLFNAGVISLETYLEKVGIEDIGEEIDRLRENYEDKVTAAVHSNSRQLLAQNVIAPAPEGPSPDVKISLKGDLTPQQEGNIAAMQGFLEGPFPATMGPQGNQGLTAYENQDNEGLLTGDPYNGGMPINVGPDGQPVPMGATTQDMQGAANGDAGSINPQLTTADNQGGMPGSMPGSGAPAVSPQGAINMNEQRNGR